MEQLISPGVFTQERDLSFLPAGISNIGAAFVGPTLKGEAFIPKIVTSYNDFTNQFGGQHVSTYVPYAVKEYLKNAGTATVTRVMTSETWSEPNSYVLRLTQVTGSTAAGTLVMQPAITGSNTYFTSSNGTVYTLIPGTTSALVSGTTYTWQSGSTPTQAAQKLVTFINTYLSSELTASSNAATLIVSASTYGNQYNSDVFNTPTGSLQLSGGTYSTIGTAFAVAYLVPNKVVASNTGSNDLTLLTGSGTVGYAVRGTNFIISSSLGSASVSFTSTSTNKLDNVFGSNPFTTSPNTLASNYYVYRFFNEFANASASYSASIQLEPMLFSTNKAYNHGKTPVITSQLVGGSAYSLFKVHRRSDGVNSNYDIKIIIEDIKKAGTVAGSDYGTFTVTVRRVGGFFNSNDTDNTPEVLESFVNLTLDPKSPNYILKRIGNRYATVNSTTGEITYVGDYPNMSTNIYIEAIADFNTIPVALVPSGFNALNPVISGSTPTPVYVTRQGTAGSYNRKTAFGFDFYSDDAQQYLYSVPDGGDTLTVGSSFNLDNMFSHASSSGVYGTNGSLFTAGTSLSSSYAPVEMLKFAVPFQHGHDGMPYNRIKYSQGDITSTNVFGFDCSTANSTGSLAYITALRTLANTEEYDINVLVTPGIISSLHSSVTDEASTTVFNRADAFYIMDSNQLTDTPTQIVSSVSTIDNNYIGTFYPWVKIKDTDTNNYVWVSPSVVVAGAFSKNDAVGEEWYAPAGLNRGNLPSVVESYRRLSADQRNVLYSNRVNPIAHFPGLGYAVWGQKTLQAKASALDRINVRRLLIASKKYIASSTRYLVFENNTNATRARFLNIVKPYFEMVKQRQGLYAFDVICDETNNTPDIVDRNILAGQIYLQPAKTSEFIIVDFNITPTGASFNNQ